MNTPETRRKDLLDLVTLTPLMERSSGRPEIAIGLIDGPVLTSHPDLAGQQIRQVGGATGGSCAWNGSVACTHGTFVAGSLAARRGSAALAICPGCTLMVRPIFPEHASSEAAQAPSATPEELAGAIVESVNAGVRLMNLSAALTHSSSRGEQALRQA